ncbi:23063_t:CDS:2 [Gigaspora rosea]|nr:23063_t:CDS:2 [Gigaspora rosea]
MKISEIEMTTIKASARMNKLISHDDDLEDVEDFRMHEIC